MELYQKEAELDRMKKMHELDLGRIDWEEELRKREEESSSKARIIEVESKTGVTQAEAQAQMRISATKAREAEIKTGAQEIETVKAGEAKVKELDERAKVAGDIAKIDADTRQKEILLKAEVEKERVKAEILKSDREFELKGKEIDGKVKIEVERARQDSNREERKSEIEKEKVIWSGKADVAEAVAKGGIEGVEAKRAAEVEYFKEASPHVDVVEVERVRALKEAPPKEMIIIETKETKPFAEPASSEEKRILELKKERYNTLVRMLSEKGISEEFANATEKEIERLKQEIERLEQLRK
jgi:hypothetical protein